MENANQYLVVPRSGDKAKHTRLLDFLDAAGKTPDVSIVRVVGERDNPKRVIIQGTESAINELKSSFDPEIIIEPDSSLNML